MKNSFLLLFLLLNVTYLPVFSHSESLVSESACEIQEEQTDALCAADKEISRLIGMSFLKARSVSVTKEWKYEEKTEEEKVFGKHGMTVSLHDVKIRISREMHGEEPFVVIETTVFGAPEDFTGEYISEVEKKLLKNVLIQAYLQNRDKIQKESGKSVTAVPIDAQTKATRPPENLVRVIKDFIMRERTEVDKTRKGMKFVTLFPAQEFDQLIHEYFTDATKKTKKSGWWW